MTSETRPPTIRDVARLSNVSPSTVSCVLNEGSRSVRPETRARIEEAMRVLNFYPSTVARGLARRRMDCIGIVLPHPNASLAVDPYFSAVLDGIFRVATKHRQNVTIYTGVEWHNSAASLPAFRDRRVDGLLLLATPTDSDIVAAFTDSAIPFVMVSGKSTNDKVSSVDIDNRHGARIAVEHLIGLGHRRIAMLGGQATSPSTVMRARGYSDALEAANISAEKEYLRNKVYNAAWGYVGMQELLALKSPPTALFAGSDMIAVGAYRACCDGGISIPETMSIVGFDDTTLATHLVPALTTIRQPLSELGARGCELLLSSLASGRDFLPEKIVLPTELIVRQSTRETRRSN